MDEERAPSPGDLAPSLSEALISSTIEALVTMDPAGKIVAFNPGAERMFGYAQNEALGRKLDDLIPERFRAAHVKHVAAFSKDPSRVRNVSARRAIFGLRKNGEEFRAEASLHKHVQDGVLLTTVVMRDLGERQWLNDVMERLQSVTADAGISFFRLDIRSGKAQVSHALAQLMDVDQNASHTLFHRSYFESDEEFDRVSEILDRAKGNEGDSRFNFEFRAHSQTMGWRWIQVVGQVQFSGEGAARRADVVIGMGLDITERVRAREVLLTLNHALEERILDRTRQLQAEMQHREEVQASLAASQRLEAIGRLSGGVAHDTNNLLTIIGGNLEMIEETLGEEAPAMRFLREAQNGVDKLSQLNRRLLTFARKRRLENVPVDPTEHVRGLEEMLRRLLGDRIDLQFSSDAIAARVVVDPVELDNAILNLAFNARDAMPSGGRLQVSVHDASIDADAARGEIDLKPGDYVVIAVTDTGLGMTPEVHARAFEPFFTTKEPGKGTGLGLATVYGFVKQSGGHVTLYSEVGRGTTVNLYLPRVADRGPVKTIEGAGPAMPKGAGELILVAEDDAQVRALTCERLRRLGYSFIEAADAQKALDLFSTTPGIALVFSDVVMGPGASGFELADMIEQRRPGQPVLLTSGFDMGAEKNGLARFAGRVLQKPYNQTALAHAVRDALGKKGN